MLLRIWSSPENFKILTDQATNMMRNQKDESDFRARRFIQFRPRINVADKKKNKQS